MTESPTNRDGLAVIAVGVFVGTVLWAIFSPFDEGTLSHWVGLAFADLLAIFTLSIAWRHLRPDRQPPAP